MAVRSMVTKSNRPDRTDRADRADRAEGILLTAARLFRERGFHATTMDDIGRAAGITGGALYRHYAGKDELLEAVAMRGQSSVRDALDMVDSTAGDDEHHLAWTVDAGGRSVIDNLDSIMVSIREMQRLSTAAYERVMTVGLSNNARAALAVRTVRPDVSVELANFLMTPLGGMYLTMAYFDTSISTLRLREIWTTMGTAAMEATPAVAFEVDAGRIDLRRRATRREALLTEAVILFREHGAAGVGMDEVGAAVGIAGPAVYRHFRGKDDLLAAAMTRAKELLAASATHALAARSAEQALERLITSYASLITDHPDLLAVYRAEVESLPEDLRTVVRVAQRQYVDEWQLAITDLAPWHSGDDARVAALAAIGLIDGYATAPIRPSAACALPVLIGIASAALRAFIDCRPGEERLHPLLP